MKKVIYLATIEGCESCKIMHNILLSFERERVKDNKLDFEIIVQDFHNLPEWIKINVPLNDFPLTVFIIDDVIKYHFDGTKSLIEIINITKDINF